VFDTNVADTALKYRIHNDQKHYELFQVVVPTEEDDDKKDKEEEGSAIKGFIKCVTDMKIWRTSHLFFSIPTTDTKKKASRNLLVARIWEEAFPDTLPCFSGSLFRLKNKL